MNKFVKKVFYLFLALPVLTFAQTTAPKNFTELVGVFIDIINTIIPVLAGLALLVFFKGLVEFILVSGDEKKHAVGRQLMIWGLIGLFVMASLWGIIRFAYDDFGFSQSRPFGIPTFTPLQ